MKDLNKSWLQYQKLILRKRLAEMRYAFVGAVENLRNAV